MASNRITSFMDASTRSLKSTPFTLAEGFEWEVQKYARGAALNELSEENYRLKKEVSDLKKVQNTDKEKIRELESEQSRKLIKIASVMVGAMNFVAAFAEQNTDRIAGVRFGVADHEFRFVVIAASEEFDWDLSEELAELQKVLLLDYADVRFSILSVSNSSKDDTDAILEHQFGNLPCPPLEQL